MLCNISQNAMGQPGGVPCQVQPGGVPWPGAYPGRGGTLAGGVPWLGGRYPGWGGTLARGVPWLGEVPWLGGYPGWGGTLAGGVPWPGAVPWLGGTLAVGVPWPGGYPGWGGTLAGGVPCWWGCTQLGQHREYLLHGGRYASCVHAGGLSCVCKLWAHRILFTWGPQMCPACSILYIHKFPQKYLMII